MKLTISGLACLLVCCSCSPPPYTAQGARKALGNASKDFIERTREMDLIEATLGCTVDKGMVSSYVYCSGYTKDPQKLVQACYAANLKTGEVAFRQFTW